MLPWHVLSNFARNSPEGVSGFEIRSLIFRGFELSMNEAPEELRATLGSGWGVAGGAAGVWLGAHRGVVGERLRASGA